jgi:hypothetical protein
MVSQSSGNNVTLVAIAKRDSEGAIVYKFEINGSNQFFDARTIDKDGIRAVEMSAPLERLLQQLFPVAPHVAKTLVEVTWTVMDGSDDVLPIRMV